MNRMLCFYALFVHAMLANGCNNANATVTGYSYSERCWRSAEPRGGPTTQLMRKLSKQYKVHIGFGFLEARGEHFYNKFVLTGPEGEVKRPEAFLRIATHGFSTAQMWRKFLSSLIRDKSGVHTTKRCKRLCLIPSIRNDQPTCTPHQPHSSLSHSWSRPCHEDALSSLVHMCTA
jgi:hypothetical protein